MGCSSAKAAQPEARSHKLAGDSASAREEPRADEAKAEAKQPAEARRPEDANVPVVGRSGEDGSAQLLSPGDVVTVAKDGGIEGRVVRRTTTDVLVNTGKGEHWFDIEDVQHWDTIPPLHREVVAGTVVTTVGGLAGTVVKRTTTEVCLRTEDGEERWCDIEDIMVVRVMIVSAADLRNADWLSKSDPYVVCQIDGKPTSIKTPIISDNLEPIWNFEASLLGFQKGDTLRFNIWDSDCVKKDDLLGVATLESEQFLESGFYGELPLADKEGQAAKGLLTVRALVEPAQQRKEDQATAAPQKPEPEVTDEMQKPTGWCC